MALRSKLALITGSTSGIGLGIMRRVAAAGADVIVHGFGDEKANQKLADDIAAEHGVQTFFHGGDLADHDAVKDLMSVPEKHFDRHLDILVNNAGIQHVSPVDEFPEDAWERVIAVNLTANFLTTKYAIRSMKHHDWGRIINIASVHGQVASANKTAYVASKHGVLGLTKAVALETAETGITANTVCPGWVLTPLVEAQIRARAEEKGTTYEQESHDLLMEKQPSGQFVQPEHIGDTVVFLCSDSASQITGQAITLDGGWTAV